MKWLGLLISLLYISSSCFAQEDLNDIDYFFKQHKSPHDIIVNNKLLSPGSEQMYYDTLYEVIHYATDNYKRPFLFVDVMPAYGYCSLKLMQEKLSATGILFVQDSPDIQISHILSRLGNLANITDRLIIMDQLLDDRALYYMAECEHCDVALIANLIKVPQWKELTPTLFKLAETIIVGIVTDGTNQADYQEACQQLDARDGVRIKTISNDSHEARFYVFYQQKNSVKRCTPNSMRAFAPHTIKSTFYQKIFIKDGIERPWYHGINIDTFKALHGVFPSQDHVLDQLEALAPFTPKGANTIIQGKKLEVLP